MIEDDESHSAGDDKSESRLARWSRRKAEQRELETSAPQSPAEVEEPLVEQAAIVEEEAEVEQDLPVLTDADMPPVESLSGDSDFSGFLSPGVSEELRKLALRKMFSLPSFKVRDGLDDYDDDFTVFEPLGDTVTNDPWTHRKKRLEEEKAAAEKAEAERLRAERQAEEEGVKAAEDDQVTETSEESEEELGEELSEESSDSEDPSTVSEDLSEQNNLEQDTSKHE